MNKFNLFIKKIDLSLFFLRKIYKELIINYNMKRDYTTHSQAQTDRAYYEKLGFPCKVTAQVRSYYPIVSYSLEFIKKEWFK